MQISYLTPEIPRIKSRSYIITPSSMLERAHEDLVRKSVPKKEHVTLSFTTEFKKVLRYVRCSENKMRNLRCGALLQVRFHKDTFEYSGANKWARKAGILSKWKPLTPSRYLEILLRGYATAGPSRSHNCAGRAPSRCAF